MLYPKHPLTLQTVGNLGLLYMTQGKLAQAEEMGIRALAGQEQVLGHEHPSTLNTVLNFAILHADQGNKQQAMNMIQRVALNRERVLGIEHHDTLMALRGLRRLQMEMLGKGKSNADISHKP